MKNGGTNCETLSQKAREIFENIKKFFPPDPWGKPQWKDSGKIFDNGWRDLRKSSHRDSCIREQKEMLGYIVGLIAIVYQKKNKSLRGFSRSKMSTIVEKHAKLLLLYEDLDFQIETGDFTD